MNILTRDLFLVVHVLYVSVFFRAGYRAWHKAGDQWMASQRMTRYIPARKSLYIFFNKKLIKTPLQGQLLSGKQVHRREMCQLPFIKCLLSARECDKHFVCLLLLILHSNPWISVPPLCLPASILQMLKMSLREVNRTLLPIKFAGGKWEERPWCSFGSKNWVLCQVSCCLLRACGGGVGSSHGLAWPKPLPLSYTWTFNGDCPFQSISAVWTVGWLAKTR